ncbi:ATP-binding protein [Sphingopyxis sp. JAI128]|uniref:ATP-binding protein n=1 Tax=Sphingopyxis sp. JAI128 TaxID=2723066 RepID=UPI00160C6A7C|nr:ATP-binding protein [Sphingopyxis sp. JAI128]MBB6427005.1 signal transduction histidine kinase [Sphingopyxis sp. JAI128]
MMRRLAGSLLFRIALLFVAGLLALQIAILAATMWPDRRPMVFRMISPSDAREVVEAIEEAPPSLRHKIAAAAGNTGTTVELLENFPHEHGGLGGVSGAPRLEKLFADYPKALDGRPIRVQTRGGTLFARPAGSNAPPRGPIRILIGLRTGEVVAIERAPVILQLLASRYLYIALVAALVLVALLLLLLWQVVRPIAKLSRAAERLEGNLDGPDLAVGGAREVRALADALNHMRRRVGGLIEDRTRMLAAIAHDLRTYITRLRLRAEHIGDARHRDRAISDIEEMARLLDDILLFAKSAASAAVPAPVIDLCAETSDYVRVRRETGDPVQLADGPAMLKIHCPPIALRRMLSNLIDNALRYGTEATLDLKRDGTDALLTVSDNGPGIAPELIDRLTQPFERIESSRGRHSGGAGLGLSIVRALAESHGGRFDLTNRPEGGLRATLCLPLAEASPELDG